MIILINKKNFILLAGIALCLDFKTAHAQNEQTCLARIGFAESQGENVAGVLAVMNATVLHARQLKISVCDVKAKQQTPANDVAVAYDVLAKNVLSGNIKPATKANTWRSKGQSAAGGEQVAKIGKHRFFYVAKL